MRGWYGQRKSMDDSRLSYAFPNLTSDKFIDTSPTDDRYNCIAFALGDYVHWWWPSDYWPSDIPSDLTIQTFIQLFKQYGGYEVCEDGSLEEDYEKIVIFAKAVKNGLLSSTHAAKQTPSGWWKSKLGKSKDIAHTKPEDLNGPLYGRPITFMRRRLS